MQFDNSYVEKFYDRYSTFEWQRLEATAYGRLQFAMHTELLKRYCKPNDHLLDAGSGPGRFSVVAAQLGARVTTLDISSEQLRLAKETVERAGLNHAVVDFIRADITDLSQFLDESFDVTLCFGGALSYVCDRRHVAARELVRVTKPGGVLLISVMSRFGAILNSTLEGNKAVIDHASKVHYWRVLKEGDLEGLQSRRLGMNHPAMHLYSASELPTLFPQCDLLEIAGSNVISFESSPTFNEIAIDKERWETLLQLEREMNHVPGLVDSGSHIMTAVKKRKV